MLGGSFFIIRRHHGRPYRPPRVMKMRISCPTPARLDARVSFRDGRGRSPAPYIRRGLRPILSTGSRRVPACGCASEPSPTTRATKRCASRFRMIGAGTEARPTIYTADFADYVGDYCQVRPFPLNPRKSAKSVDKIKMPETNARCDEAPIFFYGRTVIPSILSFCLKTGQLSSNIQARTKDVGRSQVGRSG